MALALLWVWAFTGCAGNGPPSGTGATSTPPASSSFDAIQQTIFNPHCLSAGCHNGSDHAGNLVLESGRAHANLVNAVPFNFAARAAGLLRVVPGNPDQSFLFVKLTLTGAGPMGSRMPLSAQLGQADVQRVRAWILAGAPDSSVPTSTPTATLRATPTTTPTITAPATASQTPTITSPPILTPTGTLHPTTTPTSTPPSTPTASPSQTATPSLNPTPTFSVESTLPQIQANIFATACAQVGCHTATDRQGDLVLEAGVSYAQLVGALCANDNARALGLLRVDPGKPDSSFLITKLTLAQSFDPAFGSRMPLGVATSLPAEQIERMRAWVLRGALPNE